MLPPTRRRRPVSCYWWWIEGLRVLRQWRWRGKQAGELLVAMVFLGLRYLSRASGRWKRGRRWRRASRHRAPVGVHGRAACGDCPLPAEPRSGDEWVYNGADIDGARVVWAREMDPGRQSRNLLRYFADRRAWLVEPDGATPRIARTTHPCRPTRLLRS